jgi:hypothetical protein
MKRYKPLVDKLYFLIFVPTVALMAALTAMSLASLTALIITLLCDLLVLYFLITPLFGYVELRERCVFIKYGFILKKEIPYEKIRSAELERRFYSESMMSLKNAIEHINLKFNKFDVTTVSVVGNEELVKELMERKEALK